MSVSGQASCCTSTRSGSVASGSLASECSANKPAARIATVASAGSTCTSRSTITRVWPTPSSFAGQDADNCVRFLERALAWYRAQGVAVERVMTDNAKAYHSRAWNEACTARTARAPLHPATTGRDERQGRAPDPDAAARVGLRTQLSLEQPPRTRPRRLPTLVQQASTAHRARRPTTDQPRLTPPWSRQLARDARAIIGVGLLTLTPLTAASEPERLSTRDSVLLPLPLEQQLLGRRTIVSRGLGCLEQPQRNVPQSHRLI